MAWLEPIDRKAKHPLDMLRRIDGALQRMGCFHVCVWTWLMVDLLERRSLAFLFLAGLTVLVIAVEFLPRVTGRAPSTPSPQSPSPPPAG